MKISEVFFSIQGEGKTAGMPRLFIRTSGCSLKCDFCDTTYHIKGHKMDSSEEKMLKKYDKWCFTGGEPMLHQKEISELISKYKPTWVEIETNGTIKRKELKTMNLFNISPKEKRFQPKGLNPEPILLENFKGIEKFRIVKFVYSDKKSQSFIKKIIKKYQIENDSVWIMPEGATGKKQNAKIKEVWDFCVKNNYNLSPRLHVTTFGNKKGI